MSFSTYIIRSSLMNLQRNLMNLLNKFQFYYCQLLPWSVGNLKKEANHASKLLFHSYLAKEEYQPLNVSSS